AYGVTHKCLLEVGGIPMLARVVVVLNRHPAIGRILISIEDETLIKKALGRDAAHVEFIRSGDSAAASALLALNSGRLAHPVLLTTADHALLTPEMVTDFIAASESVNADLTVGLARAEVILKAYPNAKRTFLKFGRDRVSGCNLYGLKTANSARVLQFWRAVEQDRKSPLKLMRAFGPRLLLAWATGLTSLHGAFKLASKRLGVIAVPVLMRQANAAVDVDKPADKELVERILAVN
ncbi:MAG: nucleotidyltransferase family protein, partial [Aestuariivirgaceae bacterium]|nr:nucleotidyltransferase family protein [Aestuariivirgaceae bacterium]